MLRLRLVLPERERIVVDVLLVAVKLVNRDQVGDVRARAVQPLEADVGQLDGSQSGELALRNCEGWEDPSLHFD